MGASGILGALADGTAGNTRSERMWFVAGLFLAPLVAAMLTGGSETHLTSAPVVLIAGGLFVGVGTRLANGCTSGHGVCGISRLSVRGIVATIVYILAGAATVLAFKHLLGVI
jgi:uncharacterized membrane protein YedE/YeeE